MRSRCAKIDESLSLKLEWVRSYAALAAVLIGFAFSGLPRQAAGSAQAR
jgi:hypothetical protein